MLYSECPSSFNPSTQPIPPPLPTVYPQAFTEVQLLPPSQLSVTEAFGNSLGNTWSCGKVYYGAVPAGGENAPVLVFHHGYLAGNGDTYFILLNQMYQLAYNAGYRTAWVDNAKHDDMWDNGARLAVVIDQVTAHFNTPSVTIIAHSKGGTDTETAMVHYGKFAKVDRVIGLTPAFYGSQLADLAWSSWLSWLSGPLGFRSDATRCLQVGYMSSFRRYMDGTMFLPPHPNNTPATKAKFRNFGGWGCANGILALPGVYISAQGYGNLNGGNDGVVPYNFTKRPGSVELFQPYPNTVSRVDHLEATRGNLMWQYIQPQLPTATARFAQTETTTVPDNYNPTTTVASSVQIIASNKGSRSFIIDTKAKEVVISIRHLNKDDQFWVASNTFGIDSEEIPIERSTEKNFVGGYNSVLRIARPESGEYYIKSDNAFIALVYMENSVVAELTTDLNQQKLTYEIGEAINLTVELKNLGRSMTKDADVAAIVRQTADFTGLSKDEVDEKPMLLRFKRKGNSSTYTYTLTEPLTAGVYNLSINVRSKDYARSIATSIAVVDPSTSANTNTPDTKRSTAATNYHVQVSPNPVDDIATFNIAAANTQNNVLYIYDSVGRMIFQQNLTDNATSATWNAKAAGVENGVYIAEIKNASGNKSTCMLIYMDK